MCLNLDLVYVKKWRSNLRCVKCIDTYIHHTCMCIMYNVYPTLWFVLCIPSPALRPSPCLCCFFCFCVFCVSHYNLVHLIFRIILKWVTCLIILTWPMAWNRFEEAANTKECSFKEEASSRWMTTSRSVSESFSVLFCSDNWRHLSFSARASDSMCGWRVHRRQYWKSRMYSISKW